MKRPQIWSWDCGSWFKHVQKLFFDGSQSFQTHLWLLKTSVYWTSLLHHADLQARWYIIIYTHDSLLYVFFWMLKTPFPSPLPTQVKPVKSLARPPRLFKKLVTSCFNQRHFGQTASASARFSLDLGTREKRSPEAWRRWWRRQGCAMGAVNNGWLVQY